MLTVQEIFHLLEIKYTAATQKKAEVLAISAWLKSQGITYTVYALYGLKKGETSGLRHSTLAWMPKLLGEPLARFPIFRGTHHPIRPRATELPLHLQFLGATSNPTGTGRYR